MADGYRQRLVDARIRTLHAELPAVMLAGPRGTGKTTTAARHVKTVVRLDRPAEAQAFADDPDVALRGLEEPILIDEWQLVPGVLGAIKRAVDTDPKPQRFIVTGSVRNELDGELWPGTGRLVRVSVHGMTIREQLGRVTGLSLIDRLVAGDIVDEVSAYQLDNYVDIALRSGFPEAVLSATDATREAWLESYVDQLLTRDVADVGQIRDAASFRRYFEALALNSAGTPHDKTLYDAARINAKTARRYDQLLANLLIVEQVPAWASNRLKRLNLNAKRYLVDAGLMAGGLRVDASTVLRDGDLLGRVVDTFVASQLRAELETSESRPRLFHLRDQNGRHEIDLMAEVRGRKVLAFEVKSSAAPTARDATHLRWLAETLGDVFCAGVLFHTGPRAFSLGKTIYALPISTLWAD